MWSFSLAFCAVSFASSAVVERPSVVRREVGAERNDPSQLRHSKAPPAAAASQPQGAGQRVHITRIHPAEVTAWNFLEIDQKQRFVGTPESPEDEPDDSETDQDEVSSEPGRADLDVEEAEERSASDENGEAAEAAEAGEDEASEEPGASLLSRPEKMQKSQKMKNVSEEIRMKQGLEHNTSRDNDGEDGDRFENSSKIGFERTEKLARASNESKLEDAESNASLKSQNGTKLSTGNESMATESVEAPMGRNRHRQNESEESQGDDSTEKNATIQARSKNDTVAEAEDELRKLQDALRTAERRAAKAEADLQAEKAWVSNALRNYSEEAAPHHQEKKMNHEALADLAQVLMSFESRDTRDAAKKPQDGTKLEDGVDEEGVGTAIEESIREENARQRMRHKHVKKDKTEDGPEGTDETDEEQDGSAVTEESSEEPEKSQLQKHKPWHKHKSHKHKKGGFHVYVEADGGLLEQSSRKVPHE